MRFKIPLAPLETMSTTMSNSKKKFNRKQAPSLTDPMKRRGPRMTKTMMKSVIETLLVDIPLSQPLKGHPLLRLSSQSILGSLTRRLRTFDFLNFFHHNFLSTKYLTHFKQKIDF